MKFYDGKIRLSGDLHNEVIRENMSAPEVILLRRIHGQDAVVDLVEVDDKKMKSSEERRRLYQQYPTAVNIEAKMHFITELFGPEHTPLPDELPEPVTDEDGDDAEPGRASTGRRRGGGRRGNAAATAAILA